MTEKRFTVEYWRNQNVIIDNDGPDDYYHLGNDTRDVQGICKLLNELSQDDDILIEQNHQLHKTVSELATEILKIKEEHRETEFKLRTLEKFYTCPNCAFNNKEFQYLKNLRKKDQ